jgi:hypothetical protein
MRIEMSMKKCRVCESPSTVKSHLLPRALAHDIRANQPNLHVYTINRPGFKPSQAGIYDDGILCEQHEGVIQIYDKYGVEFCRNFESNRQMLDIDIFQVEVDSDLLVRFVVSVLWRYSVSTRPETNMVHLGPYERCMGDIVFAGANCCPEPALFMWANKSTNLDVTKLCIPPAVGRFLDVRHLSFVVGGLTFVLKVDRRPVPKELALLPVNGRSIIISAYKPFDSSQEFSEMVKIITNASLSRGPRHERGER